MNSVYKLLKVALPSVFLSTICFSASADLVSTFDSNTENWRTYGDAKSLVWIATDGNPGGYLQASDIAGGGIWYFVAPYEWSGDWSKYTSLAFDLKQIGSGDGFVSDDVQIIGKNGDMLSWRGNRAPASSWTHYKIALSPQTFAVDSDTFKNVIKEVDELRIRGEFIVGPDQGGVDNVRLSETPQTLSGIVYDLGKYNLTCQNVTTGQKVIATNQTATDWDCEQSGLTISKGDQVKVTISGRPVK